MFHLCYTNILNTTKIWASNLEMHFDNMHGTLLSNGIDKRISSQLYFLPFYVACSWGFICCSHKAGHGSHSIESSWNSASVPLIRQYKSMLLQFYQVIQIFKLSVRRKDTLTPCDLTWLLWIFKLLKQPDKHHNTI